MRKRLLSELCLCAVPVVATVFTVGLWDRTTPFVLGLPFNLFWVALWAVLISALLWYIERRSRKP